MLGLPRRHSKKEMGKKRNQHDNYFCFKQAGIKSSYGTRIKNNFQAEPFQYDFQGDSNRAVNIVNNKVSRASNGGLKQFLDPSKFAKSLKTTKKWIKCASFL